MMTGVQLDPLEYGRAGQWVLLKGAPKFVVPEGWKKVAKPRSKITPEYLKGLVSKKRRARLMWRWDAPIDWACGSFVRANRGSIRGSPSPCEAGHVVVNYGETGHESKHDLRLDQYGTGTGKLWVLIENNRAL